MKRLHVVLGVALAVVAAFGGVGCSGATPGESPEAIGADKVTPPATPGTAETLVGSEWTAEGNTFSFQAQGRGTLVASNTGATMSMAYSVKPDGVVYIAVGATTLMGTWDGQQLLLDGREAARVK